MTQSLVRENRILSALLEVSKVLNSSFDLEKNLSRSIDEDIRVLEIVASIIGQYAILWKHYRESEQERENLKLELRGRYNTPNIIGSSDKMEEQYFLMRLAISRLIFNQRYCACFRKGSLSELEERRQ